MKRNDIEYTMDADEQIVQDCADNRNEYICDAISETADAAIDIYTADLLEWASKNYEWIDEAANNGLCDIRNCDNVMIKLAQAGQYEYYTHMLYENKAAIALNYAFDYMDADEIPDELAEQIIDAAGGLDKFAEIEQIIDDYKADHE